MKGNNKSSVATAAFGSIALVLLLSLLCMMVQPALSLTGSWAQVFVRGNPPPARVFAASSNGAPVPPPYNPSERDGFVIFGGTTTSTFAGEYYNDVWILNSRDTANDGRGWTMISVVGEQPPARCLSAIAVEPDTMIMYMFGGFNGTDWFGDLWALNISVVQYLGKSSQWERIITSSGPTPICGMTMILCPVVSSLPNALIMFGGGTDKRQVFRLYNKLWSFDPNTETWAEVYTEGITPDPREFHGAYCVNPINGSMVVFGGYDYGYSFFNDTTSLINGDPAYWESSPPGLTPGGRASFAGTAFKNQVVIFGGIADTGESYTVFDDVWSFGESWQQVNIVSVGPGLRFGSASGTYAQSSGLVVFGGQDDEGAIYDDLWVLNLDSDPTTTATAAGTGVGSTSTPPTDTAGTAAGAGVGSTSIPPTDTAGTGGHQSTGTQGRAYEGTNGGIPVHIHRSGTTGGGSVPHRD